MLSRQSCKAIDVADLFGIRQNENCRCAFSNHGTKKIIIAVGIEKFLDADAALVCFTPKLPYAEIGLFCAEKCNMGHLWRCFQKEVDLFAVEIWARVDRDPRNVARSLRKARYDLLLHRTES